MKKVKGFTLLELMIVVIILAILVIIAIPLYTRAVERGRMAEAYSNLGAIRNAELRYYQEHAEFTGDVGNLDIDDPNITATQGKSYFSDVQGTPNSGGYSISATSTTFTATANRNDLENPVGDYSVTIDQAGVISGGP